MAEIEERTVKTVLLTIRASKFDCAFVGGLKLINAVFTRKSQAQSETQGSTVLFTDYLC
jgi:hypothetical protein